MGFSRWISYSSPAEGAVENLNGILIELLSIYSTFQDPKFSIYRNCTINTVGGGGIPGHPYRDPVFCDFFDGGNQAACYETDFRQYSLIRFRRRGHGNPGLSVILHASFVPRQ
jgi:hypothetical protein